MARTLTAAVVGAGFIGPVHVEGLRRAGVGVAGILGSDPDKSRAAAERLGLPRGYGSLEEVLADRDVAAVHLTTPNRCHFQQAAAVLRAGKHVLCEKPLAMNSSESAELVRLAAESGMVAGVAYNIRFYPLCHETAARLRDATFGDVLHVSGSYVQDWLLFDTDFNWRVLADDGGTLRAVADIGTHWLDLIQFMTMLPDGPPCGCGNHGCLETLASGPAIIGECVRLLRAGLAPHLYALVEGNADRVTPREVLAAAEAGDDVVREALERAATYIGIAAANVVAVLHPDLIVVGGGVAEMGDILLNRVRQVIHHRVKMVPTENIRVERSKFGGRAGIMGAVALARDID